MKFKAWVVLDAKYFYEPLLYLSKGAATFAAAAPKDGARYSVHPAVVTVKLPRKKKTK